MPRDKINGYKIPRKCVGVSLQPSTYQTTPEVELTLDQLELQEMKKLEKSISNMETIGFTFPTYREETDKKRAAFRGKASLWKAIRISIAELFFPQLEEGKLFIEDIHGDKYGLKLILENRERIFPDLPDEGPDDLHR